MSKVAFSYVTCLNYLKLQNTFSLFQPIDVSHIYEPDLHERRQKRLPKNNKKGPEVRSVLVQIQLHSVSLKSSLTRDFHMLSKLYMITIIFRVHKIVDQGLRPKRGGKE